MSGIYLLSADHDPVGNAVAALLGETEGFQRIAPGDSSVPALSSNDVLLVGECGIGANSAGDISPAGLVQFLDCRPDTGLVSQLLGAGTRVAGISSVIAPRVANRVAGFGGPLRVKPDAYWGLIGLGTVGVEVARKLKASGASVGIAEIRTPRSGVLAELSIRRQSLDLLVAGSDAVSIHVFPGPTASPLISRRELGLMKDGAVLINSANSSVVDEQAVVEALVDGALGGYATDCPGETIAKAGADESPVSSSKLFITTNPLTNQVGAAQQIAKHVAANVAAVGTGTAITGQIDLVDFPVIGDPSFWSSRMSPRQD